MVYCQYKVCFSVQKDPAYKFVLWKHGMEFSTLSLKFTACNQIRIREEEERLRTFNLLDIFPALSQIMSTSFIVAYQAVKPDL